MPCAVCSATEALLVCAICARTVCDRHRGTTDGLSACTACVEAEHARRVRARAAAEALTSPATARPVGQHTTDAGSTGEGLATDTAPSAAAPLAEPPPVVAPLALGGLAGGGALVYAWWLLQRTAREGAIGSWVVGPAAVACAVFAFAGVWTIVRVRWPRAGEHGT